MHIGVGLRNMGDQSAPATMGACARAAEDAGMESVWVTDHIAIPPDDAEGSGGRYVEPLIALAWVAGATRTIGLGVGVLILPYRTSPLLFAKQTASVQELSGGRLLLGVGVGWMEAEFRALGVDRRRRGRISDETLAFLRECFDQDEVTANGQPFLFRPRPACPPIYIGGAAPHALRRAARYGDGWFPTGMTPEQLPEVRAQYAEFCAAEGRSVGEIMVMGRLPSNDAGAAGQYLADFAHAGASRFVLSGRYADSDEYRRTLDVLVAAMAEAGL